MRKWLLSALVCGGFVFNAMADAPGKKVSAIGSGRTFYVNVAVKESGDGLSRKRAFKTIQEAADRVQAGDVVEIAGGVYRESVTINARGTRDRNILFRARSGNAKDRVVICGADLLDLSWKKDAERTANCKSGKVTGQVWVAQTNDIRFQGSSQLFINGRMQFVAQWPDRAGEGQSLNQADLSDLFMKPVFSLTQEGSDPEKVMDTSLSPALNLTGAVFNYKGSAQWRGWYGRVIGLIPGGFAIENESPNKYERVKKDRKYYISHALDLLNVPGEWYHDSLANKLYVCLDKNKLPRKMEIEVKTRTKGLEFGKRAAYVTVENIDLFAANLIFQAGSSHCTVDRMEAAYLNYDHQKASRAASAVQMSGDYNAIWNSEIAYTCRGGITTYGLGNRVINCHAHHIDYGFTGAGAFSPYGDEAVFYHNTAHHVSRSMIGGSGWGGRIAYNHFYDCGMLTNDCGMIYFGTSDGGGMEIDHNIVHDNWSPDNAMGIYFDCGVQNYTIHHNVMYNIKTYGLSFNVPSPTMLVFNNTIYDTGGSMNDWGWADLPAYRNDQNGTYVMNNILDWTHFKGNKDPMLFTLSPTAVVRSQIVSPLDQKSTDLFRDPENRDFTLLPADAPTATERTRLAHGGGTPIAGLVKEGNAYIGAFNPKAPRPWEAGCTTDEAGNPDPTGKYALDRTCTVFMDESGHTAIDLKRPKTEIPYLNRVYNSSFENRLQGWKKEGAQAPVILATTSSSMHFGDVHANGDKAGRENVRSARYSLCFRGKDCGISQRIEGVKPHTDYVVSVWAQIRPGQELAFGIRKTDTDEVIQELRTADVNNGIWKRHEFEFDTGGNTAVTLYVKSLHEAVGEDMFVSLDNVALQEKFEN